MNSLLLSCPDKRGRFGNAFMWKKFSAIALLSLMGSHPTIALSQTPIDFVNPLNGSTVTIQIASIHSHPTSILYSIKKEFETATTQVISSMGLFIGPAPRPPVSIVGWDFHPHLNQQIFCGVFLTRNF